MQITVLHFFSRLTQHICVDQDLFVCGSLGRIGWVLKKKEVYSNENLSLVTKGIYTPEQ